MVLDPASPPRKAPGSQSFGSKIFHLGVAKIPAPLSWAAWEVLFKDEIQTKCFPIITQDISKGLDNVFWGEQSRANLCNIFPLLPSQFEAGIFCGIKRKKLNTNHSLPRCSGGSTPSPAPGNALLSGPSRGAFPHLGLPAQLLRRLHTAKQSPKIPPPPPPWCWVPTPGAVLNGDIWAGSPHSSMKLAGSCPS